MYEKIVLPNGVRLVYEHIDYVRSVSVGIFVGVGSRFESAAENGAAHFIEHMLFKGTQRRTASQLASEMDAVGGRINACTTRESTCFYAQVLDSHLDRAVDILCDMFFNSRFAEEDVVSERGVVLEEIGMYDDSPDDLVVERLLSRCFPGALGRPILGREKTLSELNGKALRDFKERHYTPERIVVALSGSFADADIRSLSERFSALAPKASPSPARGAYKPARCFRKKATEQNQLCLGFEGLPADAETRFSNQLMSLVLGGSMSSRLFQSVREQNGLCYSIYSFSSAFADTGMFGVCTACDRETDLRALELIADELSKMREDGVTEDELSRAREQAKANLVIALESTSARMNRLGYGELTLGKSLDPTELVERYDSVTRGDVLDSARRLLRPETLSLSALGRLSPEEEYAKALKRFK